MSVNLGQLKQDTIVIQTVNLRYVGTVRTGQYQNRLSTVTGLKIVQTY